MSERTTFWFIFRFRLDVFFQYFGFFLCLFYIIFLYTIDNQLCDIAFSSTEEESLESENKHSARTQNKQ